MLLLLINKEELTTTLISVETISIIRCTVFMCVPVIHIPRYTTMVIAQKAAAITTMYNIQAVKSNCKLKHFFIIERKLKECLKIHMYYVVQDLLDDNFLRVFTVSDPNAQYNRTNTN